MDQQTLIIGIAAGLAGAAIAIARRKKASDQNASASLTETSFSTVHHGGGPQNFFMKVDDVFSIIGRGTVVTGKIESGTVKVGDELILKKNSGVQKKVKVKGVEKFRKLEQSAVTGENVGLLLEGVEKNDVNKDDVLECVTF